MSRRAAEDLENQSQSSSREMENRTSYARDKLFAQHTYNERGNSKHKWRESCPITNTDQVATYFQISVITSAFPSPDSLCKGSRLKLSSIVLRTL